MNNEADDMVEDVYHVYEEASKAREESKAEYIIVMEDFNAKIGKC